VHRKEYSRSIFFHSCKAKIPRGLIKTKKAIRNYKKHHTHSSKILTNPSLKRQLGLSEGRSINWWVPLQAPTKLWRVCDYYTYLLRHFVAWQPALLCTQTRKTHTTLNSSNSEKWRKISLNRGWHKKSPKRQFNNSLAENPETRFICSFEKLTAYSAELTLCFLPLQKSQALAESHISITRMWVKSEQTAQNGYWIRQNQIVLSLQQLTPRLFFLKVKRYYSNT